ncbi:hypothetical protein [Niallia taxi]|uniref:hypothetical protein n=1 Tax=Niallia taxi TaxID=2499688 RepID=UPI0015F4F103|nr:hypothetical protein [Niallia taxi]
MTDNKEKIEQAIKNSKASIEIEGYKVKPEYDDLVRKKLYGEISEEEFLRLALKLARGEE